MENAGTWEPQALVRARFVAGDRTLRSRFEEIRAGVLGRKRDPEKLLEDVVAMREKMRRHLEKGTSKTPDSEGDEVLVSGFDLKHGAGAMVDIEFMVQYAVLAWTLEYPGLARWTDKMRILEELAALGLFTEDEKTILQEAYLAYRSAVHYQWLGGEMTSFERLNRYREDVVAIWNSHMTPEHSGI
ncbi:MAG: bifunctional glutamine synthetase adenylyltransferase/deadenyltransferase, partial [Pseudomonadales bacterium]|nr:bifunctional glutamine synthetase adenylyltransferase/deadenyltransferase [Pseudomonadales bacterium]